MLTLESALKKNIVHHLSQKGRTEKNLFPEKKYFFFDSDFSFEKDIHFRKATICFHKQLPFKNAAIYES